MITTLLDGADIEKSQLISTEKKSTKRIQEVMISEELSKVIPRFLCFLKNFRIAVNCHSF